MRGMTRDHDILVVGEGFVTMLSLVEAALSPDGLLRLCIAVDRDLVGQRAADGLSARGTELGVPIRVLVKSEP